MLKNLNFRISYNTSDHNIIKDFNELALTNSIEYYRGVGYFTSGWLKKNAQGLAEFIQRECKIKFITSPNIEENRFGFEPEITAKIAKLECPVYEVGISYSGRTYAEGKKINWKDGLHTLWCILKYNL